MSPKETEVLLCEDDEFYREWVGRLLERAGLSLFRVAVSLDEALLAVAELEDNDIVAIVDANLSAMHCDGTDGQAIIEAIRERCPKAKIIGFSHASMPNVDFDLTKGGMREIARVVRDL